jgi:hypothetical protein
LRPGRLIICASTGQWSQTLPAELLPGVQQSALSAAGRRRANKASTCGAASSCQSGVEHGKLPLPCFAWLSARWRCVASTALPFTFEVGIATSSTSTSFTHALVLHHADTVSPVPLLFRPIEHDANRSSAMSPTLLPGGTAAWRLALLLIC